MSKLKEVDPFEVLVLEAECDEFSELARCNVSQAAELPGLPSAVTARLHGFDLDERPLLVGLPGLPHEVVPARTVASLLRHHVGAMSWCCSSKVMSDNRLSLACSRRRALMARRRQCQSRW